MGSEQVSDDLTFKYMDVLRKQTQSLKPLFLDACNVKQILTMIARIKLF